MMKEQKDIIAKILDRAPERDREVGKPEELPNMMAALSNRIEKFVFDPDADMSFSKWFSRYKEVFSEDAKQLTESNKVRLFCEKLDSMTFEKYQRHVLPEDVSQIGFNATIEALKQLFDYKTSLFTTRYSASMDFWLEITARSGDQAKINRDSGQRAQGRKKRIFARVASRMRDFLSLRRDSEIVAGGTKLVEAAMIQTQKQNECWNCGGKHYARQCKSKPWFCKKCRKTGHREKFCDSLREKKPDVQEEKTKKMRSSDRESKGEERLQEDKFEQLGLRTRRLKQTVPACTSMQ
ncbi:zinc knuckle [Teladorsagia circumcincta]|uniref:Zinc knuckle n=1 Tax=Teladorsagia circumcincta TaxID=45464 RepID=A0A2G9TRJ7_TELCI|nr:zinc knuckle [Teladorsagia circumcincta]